MYFYYHFYNTWTGEGHCLRQVYMVWKQKVTTKPCCHVMLIICKKNTSKQLIRTLWAENWWQIRDQDQAISVRFLGVKVVISFHMYSGKQGLSVNCLDVLIWILYLSILVQKHQNPQMSDHRAGSLAHQMGQHTKQDVDDTFYEHQGWV